jgi:putative transposase
VPARVSPVERIRAEIDQLFADPSRDLAKVIEEVARLGAQLLLQTALEAKVTAFLGRDRYQRDPDANPGYRNGHQPVSVKTTRWAAHPAAPQAAWHRPALRLPAARHPRDPDQRAGGAGDRRVRPRPVHRDVEATLAEALGPQAALSRSTVSRICAQLAEEFTAWSTRRLDDVALDYLYLDGTSFRDHPGARAEPVLVAYGITTAGSPVFPGLVPAASEGHDPWIDFLADLTGRGLRPPLLVVSDGGPWTAERRRAGLPQVAAPAVHHPQKPERNNVSFSVFGLAGVVCAACASRWRFLVNSPPGSRCCCRT